MRRPVNTPYAITTQFGERDSYAKFGYHSGVDYAVATGRQVFAPASGTLTNVVSPTGGNMVVIFDGQFYHRLMHNSSFSRANGRVSEGDEVARAGSTGLSTGPHVHWDINDQGTYPSSFAAFKDPAKWLNGEYQVKPIGDKPMNPQEESNAYQIVLQRAMEHGGSGRTGYKFIVDAKAELDKQREAIRNQLTALQTALKNEQAKPPKEVVRTITEIVEKIVEVQSPVDEEAVVRGWFKRQWDKVLATLFTKKS